MIPEVERRVSDGLAVFSQRARMLSPRLAAAAIPARFLPLASEPHLTLPAARPPILLDTVALTPMLLTRQLLKLADARLPTIALIAPGDTLVASLCAACPAVRLLVSDAASLHLLHPWLRQLAWPLPANAPPATCLLLPAPKHHPFGDDLLTILSALETTATLGDAADRWGRPRSAISRLQRQVRQALGAAGAGLRLHPAELASAIYASLAANGSEV